MKRSGRPLLSALLLALSAALFAVGGYLFLEGREEEPRGEVPAATPGRNEVVHVTSALEAEGIEVEYSPRAVRSRILEEVGQAVTLDGTPAYVFLYEDPVEREAVTLDVLPEDVDLAPTGGTPVPTDGLRLLQGSNVALVVLGGDDELAQRADAALATLP